MEELKDFPPEKSLALSELPVRVRKMCETVRLCGQASGSQERGRFQEGGRE